MYRYAGSVKHTEEDPADLTIDNSMHSNSINSDQNDDGIKEEVVR